MHARPGSGIRRRAEAGFTMIEVMVALLLTAIALLGIIALFTTQTRSSAFSRHMTEASVLAEDRLEKLRTMATPAASTDTNVTDQGKTGGIFTRTATATLVGSYYDLVVTVTWNDDGFTHTVQLRGRRN